MLRGMYVPLITPYASDGSVALESVARLAAECLDAGAAGIVALGTTGEAPMLDDAEQQAVVDACAPVCSERGAHLVIGAGTASTSATIGKVRALADRPEVTAVLCVVPYYVRPSQDGIVAHFEAVAAASPAPVVVYNIPARTGRLLEPDGLLRLAALDGIVGVKQATGTLDEGTLRVVAEAPPGFSVLGGDDSFLFPLTLLGGAGAIAAGAHVCTRRFVEMIECGLAAKVEEGRAHHDALLPVVRACFAEPNPSVFKAVLHAQGRIPTPDVRLPLVNASPQSLQRALDAISEAGG